MFTKIKNLFTKKTEIKPREYYEVSNDELLWALEKIMRNRKKYEAIFTLKGNGAWDSWRDVAVLHFIVFRLNFGCLDKLKPASVVTYHEHYYYLAALKLAALLERNDA